MRFFIPVLLMVLGGVSAGYADALSDMNNAMREGPCAKEADACAAKCPDLGPNDIPSVRCRKPCQDFRYSCAANMVLHKAGRPYWACFSTSARRYVAVEAASAEEASGSVDGGNGDCKAIPDDQIPDFFTLKLNGGHAAPKR